VLIINSSYTASLTSILTVQQLATGITGLDHLVASDLPIGYQAGKFTRNYLMDELNIPESRLIALSTVQEFTDALNRGPENGGVAAIVDEMPYVKIFLSSHCNFKIVGQEFTQEGWGFVCSTPISNSLLSFCGPLIMERTKHAHFIYRHSREILPLLQTYRLLSFNFQRMASFKEFTISGSHIRVAALRTMGWVQSG
jgi:hypothetical protein